MYGLFFEFGGYVVLVFCFGVVGYGVVVFFCSFVVGVVGVFDGIVVCFVDVFGSVCCFGVVYFVVGFGVCVGGFGVFYVGVFFVVFYGIVFGFGDVVVGFGFFFGGVVVGGFSVIVFDYGVGFGDVVIVFGLCMVDVVVIIFYCIVFVFGSFVIGIGLFDGIVVSGVFGIVWC